MAWDQTPHSNHRYGSGYLGLSQQNVSTPLTQYLFELQSTSSILNANMKRMMDGINRDHNAYSYGFLLCLTSVLDLINRKVSSIADCKLRYSQILALVELEKSWNEEDGFLVDLGKIVPLVDEFRQATSELKTLKATNDQSYTQSNEKNVKRMKERIFGYGSDDSKSVVQLLKLVKNRMFHRDSILESLGTSVDSLGEEKLFELNTYFGPAGAFPALLDKIYEKLRPFCTMSNPKYDSVFRNMRIFYTQESNASDNGFSWLDGSSTEASHARYIIMLTVFFQAVNAAVKSYHATTTREKKKAVNLKKKHQIGFKVAAEIQHIAGWVFTCGRKNRQVRRYDRYYDPYCGWLDDVVRAQWNRQIPADRRAICDILDMASDVNFHSVRSLLMSISKMLRHLSSYSGPNGELYINDHSTLYFWMDLFPRLANLLVQPLYKFKDHVVNHLNTNGEFSLLGMFYENYVASGTTNHNPGEHVDLCDFLKDYNNDNSTKNIRRMGMARDYPNDRLYQVPFGFKQQRIQPGDLLDRLRDRLRDAGMAEGLVRKINHQANDKYITFILFPESFLSFKSVIYDVFTCGRNALETTQKRNRYEDNPMVASNSVSGIDGDWRLSDNSTVGGSTVGNYLDATVGGNISRSDQTQYPTSRSGSTSTGFHTMATSNSASRVGGDLRRLVRQNKSSGVFSAFGNNDCSSIMNFSGDECDD